MATYKLIQDIEAEDHILGPLTLRQFIFGLVGAFFFYLSFIVVAKHAPFLLIFFLPPGLFCAFFAIPFGRDQPTEIWALAKLRFWFKPRRRLWDQSGVKELVTITVPKKVERVLTNGLSQGEVESRLTALASTLDSRGWAIKNAALGGNYMQANPLMTAESDRLIDINNVPAEVPNYDVRASDDILDETSNPVAQQFNAMINQSEQTHRQQLINEMNAAQATAQAAGQTGQKQPDAGADYWFQPKVPAPSQPTVIGRAPQAASDSDEAALAAQIKAHNDTVGISSAHMRTLQPLGSQPVSAAQTTAPAAPPPAVTAAPDPAILSLASNDDLNVSTLAREAYKAKHGEEPPQDEVVISLH
ncbi:MAG TPA: PrgI family protein [Candidatus Saccharimonadales bacterium]|nr:PrgI family protein [Candidatus Saccharimonadales bacterium]